LVVHGENGYVVADCHRQTEMVALIAQFAGLSEDCRQRMSQAAVQAGAACDWDRHVDALETMFTEVIALRSGNRDGAGVGA